MSVDVTYELAGKMTRKTYKSYSRAITSMRKWFEKNDGRAIIYRFNSKPEVIETLCQLPVSAKSETSFYQTRAWRTLRLTVLRESDGLCTYCGSGIQHGSVMHVDHIKPRSKYPHLALDISNLQVLCEDCNFGKMDNESLCSG
ncbi:HNH endonuclease [Alteromonas sp. C1M14]|uniref:HNH endonuclease n=1 Tax=Alteromonas sp. C1M14 TaxID=2841567 RepID=UPI001C08AE46|nr:HNH endonuclease [Alteromonas sp. C1M14]MBU2979710.1 HNH endonuclease [Alteromonas sp. C1M14]